MKYNDGPGPEMDGALLVGVGSAVSEDTVVFASSRSALAGITRIERESKTRRRRKGKVTRADRSHTV